MTEIKLQTQSGKHPCILTKIFSNGKDHYQGQIQKIQNEGAEFPPPPPSQLKLYFSGHAAYSIVGVFVMQSKVMLKFWKKELKGIL